ncbi:MAG: CBS domain-containing protein [Longimicrobiales bacterium]|nr:CBS domain-containing protein [Longimicrobiales bacterium]
MGRDLAPAPERDAEAYRAFTKALLTDLHALDRMLREGLIETGVRRVGAEQEIFLVDAGFRPSPVGVEVLERLGGRPFTPELARFNLEVNLDPALLDGHVFRDLETAFLRRVREISEAAQTLGSEAVLTGILPTLSKSDLTLANLTPRPRYHALNDALNQLRGGVWRLRIEGVDELLVEHDSVMLEACNTSCQVHLQVDPDEFADLYNIAQAVTGPVLAAAVNSPLLFGRRLWAETRIALFQQSLDTRSSGLHTREMSARVHFGEGWIRKSVTELFHEDVARFRTLLAEEVDEDPIALLDAGEIPRLQALGLFNSTVYRWNRPCYGVGGGRPHLRIECRVLPSGPTVVDEIANAAFWIGAVLGARREYGDITQVLDFDDAKENFFAAAKLGLRSALTWADGHSHPAPRLVLDTLLPLARAGLESYGIAPEDISRYLGVVHDRVKTLSTGSRWMIRSLHGMKDTGTRSERMAALTEAMSRMQQTNEPVHTWELAAPPRVSRWRQNFERIEQYMTTDLFTVNEDELVELVAFLMEKKEIRHVLVEDRTHNLVGIVSYRSVLRLVAESGAGSGTRPVKEIMERDPVTVEPETPTRRAIDLMRTHAVSALPVVKDGKLVGIVSERDFMAIAYHLLEERLRDA